MVLCCKGTTYLNSKQITKIEWPAEQATQSRYVELLNYEALLGSMPARAGTALRCIAESRVTYGMAFSCLIRRFSRI